ncbi:hypothetical protein VTN00DRAFT_3290 [Thermoascus crustaceus]|uniref:uncharacterized protein n=1 Tax=Thermoascus crustaceus TaxID=5088 RepID=UPI003742886C
MALCEETIGENGQTAVITFEFSAWTAAREYGPAGAKNTQRLTEYPEDQPPPDDNPENNKISWVFKHNYTFSLIDDGSTADAWWGRPVVRLSTTILAQLGLMPSCAP